MAGALVKLESVTFRYPKSGAEALSRVSLQIPKGSFFALLGPNGAGKTTLMRLLCGRLGHFEGTVSIDGIPGFLKAADFGILLENPGVYPKLSIEEYLSYFAGFYGMGEGACMRGGEARARVENFAARLDLPALTSRMSTLSLGNRQKVQILRALVHSPKILILDEPVANLDPSAREAVWKLIAEWREREGGTAIVCSHILAEMESEATDYAIIDRGRVLKSGKVEFAHAVELDGVADLNRNVEFDGVADLNLAVNLNRAVNLDCAGSEFSLKLASRATAEQVAKALASAGIDVAAVKIRGLSLSDIYRETIKR